MSPLQGTAGLCYVRFEVSTAVTMKNVFWDIKVQFVPHRKHITSSDTAKPVNAM
jgi:hypothetical protein